MTMAIIKATIMAVVMAVAQTGTKQEVVSVEEAVQTIVEELLQEKCVWPSCGGQKYEVCLMPTGCRGKWSRPYLPGLPDSFLPSL